MARIPEDVSDSNFFKQLLLDAFKSDDYIFHQGREVNLDYDRRGHGRIIDPNMTVEEYKALKLKRLQKRNGGFLPKEWYRVWKRKEADGSITRAFRAYVLTGTYTVNERDGEFDQINVWCKDFTSSGGCPGDAWYQPKDDPKRQPQPQWLMHHYKVVQLSNGIYAFTSPSFDRSFFHAEYYLVP
jgi:hypothetical protein